MPFSGQQWVAALTPSDADKAEHPLLAYFCVLKSTDFIIS